MIKRSFSSLRSLQHENPLVRLCHCIGNFLANIHLCQGLPRSGVPPILPRRQRGLPEKRSIRDVRKVIAVSSAKGGVGKSTIAGKNEYLSIRAPAPVKLKSPRNSQPCPRVRPTRPSQRYPRHRYLRPIGSHPPEPLWRTPPLREYAYLPCHLLQHSLPPKIHLLI